MDNKESSPASKPDAPAPARNKPSINPAYLPAPTDKAPSPPPAVPPPPPLPAAKPPFVPPTKEKPAAAVPTPTPSPTPLPENPAARETPGTSTGPGETGKGAAAKPTAAADYLVRAKAIYDKLFPVESPQRKYGPLILAVSVLLLLLLAKCAVSSVGEKISAVSQAHAEATRARTTGVLVVKSNRPEATVEVTRLAGDKPDDKASDSAKGALGQALPGLTPGKYAVTVRAEGWPDAHGEVNVTAGQQIEATVNFKGGSLRLDSDPAGATVSLAGAALGKTPLVIPQLPLGDVQLSVQYASWPVVPVKAIIRENMESAATVHLPHGRLLVESTPSGAAVLVGGRVAGKTPLTLDPVPAGAVKLTLQSKDYPPLEASVTVADRGEVKFSRELGYGFPVLDPAALLEAVWMPANPNQLAPGVDSTGRYEPRNGVVKNLSRKKLYDFWLRRTYRFSATVKSGDPKSGKVEFEEQASDLSRYRVVAGLTLAARSDKDLAARLTKGATLTLYGRLTTVEEPHWPFKVITLELSAAELLREER